VIPAKETYFLEFLFWLIEVLISPEQLLPVFQTFYIFGSFYMETKIKGTCDFS
jgi:hypothetical protein